MTIGFGGPSIGFLNPGGLDGVGELTSLDSTVDIVDPTGPVSDLSVGAALDVARRTFGGNFGIIDNIDDLDIYAPPDGVTGERTIAGQFWLSNKITMRAGEWCSYGVNGVLVGPSAAACGLIGDVDGPLISGPVVASGLCFSNSNAGVNAKHLAVTGGGSRILRIEFCACLGTSAAGTIDNASNFITIDKTLVLGSSDGFAIGGSIAGLAFLDCAFVGLPAGHVGISVGATAVVVAALSFTGNTFVTGDPTDRGIRIDESATLPGVPVTDPVTPSAVVGVSITGSVFIGPGQLYDQGAGALPLDSPRIITEGNPTVINSRYLGPVKFEDYITPIALVYVGPAPTAWQVVPSENVGPATVLALLASAARFSLFRDVADPLNWYIQADGPTSQSVSLIWDISLEADSGGGAGEFLEYRITKQALGVGTWDPVEGSTRRMEQRVQSTSSNHTAYDVANVADRYRLETRNFTGTSATDLQHYNVTVAST